MEYLTTWLAERIVRIWTEHALFYESFRQNVQRLENRWRVNELEMTENLDADRNARIDIMGLGLCASLSIQLMHRILVAEQSRSLFTAYLFTCQIHQEHDFVTPHGG